AEILELPADNGKMDPDLFIREKGLAAFRRLPARSYQYWCWREQMNRENNLEVANEACLQIVKQPDPLLRWDMLVNLQAVVGLPVEVLWETAVRLARGTNTVAARDIVASVPMMALLRENLEQARAAEVTELDTEGKRCLLTEELVPMAA